MRKLPFYKILPSFFFASALFVSCTTDVDWENKLNDLKLDQSLVLPLGEAVLSLDDIITQFDSLEFVDTQGSDVYVKLNDSLSWQLNQIPALGNNNPSIISGINPLIGTLTNNKWVLAFPKEMDLALNSNTNEQRIDQIKAKSAQIGIIVTAQNAVMQPGDVIITFKFDPTRLKFADGSSEISYSPQSFDLLGELPLPAFTLDLPNAASVVPSIVQLEFKTTNTVYTPATNISINFKYTKIESEVIYGFFSPTLDLASQQQIVDLSGIVSKIPNNGSFKLSDPEINFDIASNVGIRLGLNIDKIDAYQESNPSNLVPAWFTENNIRSNSTKRIINRVTAYGQPNSKSIFKLNKDSGEIHNFFNQTYIPDKLKYVFRVTNERVSKLPTVSEPADFITPQSSIKAKVTVKVPLKLSAGSWFELKDTIADLNLDSILDNNLIEKVQLILKVTNGLPVQTTMGLKFIDLNGAEIQGLNLIDNPIIPAPALKSDGSVDSSNSPTSKLVNIIVNKDQIPNLKNAKKLVYTLRIDSKDANTPIYFQKENSFRVKLGVYLKGDAAISFE